MSVSTTEAFGKAQSYEETFGQTNAKEPQRMSLGRWMLPVDLGCVLDVTEHNGCFKQASGKVKLSF